VSAKTANVHRYLATVCSQVQHHPLEAGFTVCHSAKEGACSRLCAAASLEHEGFMGALPRVRRYDLRRSRFSIDKVGPN
jgi:hypothetical protein